MYQIVGNPFLPRDTQQSFVKEMTEQDIKNGKEAYDNRNIFVANMKAALALPVEQQKDNAFLKALSEIRDEIAEKFESVVIDITQPTIEMRYRVSQLLHYAIDKSTAIEKQAQDTSDKDKKCELYMLHYLYLYAVAPLIIRLENLNSPCIDDMRIDTTPDYWNMPIYITSLYLDVVMDEDEKEDDSCFDLDSEFNSYFADSLDFLDELIEKFDMGFDKSFGENAEYVTPDNYAEPREYEE